MVLMVPLVVFFSACGKDAGAVSTVEKAPLVAVETLKRGPAYQGLELSGQFRAEHETQLGFRVAGKVSERAVKAGQLVEAGDLLYALDDADYRLNLEAMAAQEAAAQAQFQDADDQLNRNRRLLEQQYISQAQFDRVYAAWEQAQAGLDATSSQRRNAENSLEYTRLIATEPGIVLEVVADQGQVVAAGQPVVVLAGIANIEAEVYLPERYVDRLSVGDEVALRASFEKGIEMRGEVREIAGMADPRTRTFRTRVALEKPEQVKRLGGSVTVLLRVPMDESAVMVEPDAICGEAKGEQFVWVLQADGRRVERQDIEILGAVEGDFLVRGVEAGNQVVTRGARFLQHGTEVRVSRETADAS